MIIDFQGDLTVDTVRSYLRKDGSSAAKAVLNKLADEKNVSDMMIVLADCLIEPLRAAATEAIVTEQLQTYAES